MQITGCNHHDDTMEVAITVDDLQRHWDTVELYNRYTIAKELLFSKPSY